MDGLHFEGNGRFCGRDETIRVARFSFGGQREGERAPLRLVGAESR